MECLTFLYTFTTPITQVALPPTLWVAQPPMAVYQMVVAVCRQPGVSLSQAVKLSIAFGSMGEE